MTEGSDAVFKLTRTGDTDDALPVALSASETGSMISGTAPTSVTFAAEASETELRIPTAADTTDEDDSTQTVTLTAGDMYGLGTNEQRTAALDDDAAELSGGTVAVAGTTVWTADMTVTDYGNGSIGAGTASLLANQRGSEGLQARHLYYHTGERKLRMAFTTGVNTGSLALGAGNVKLAFPAGTSGDSSFTWDGIDVDWADEQTFEARLVRGEQEAVEAPDPTLKALTVSDATFSPAFRPGHGDLHGHGCGRHRAVTISGTLNDDDASLAYTPSADADSSTAGHQVDVAVGDTTATITVTAADGQTTRVYRVVVKRSAAAVVETTAPTVSVAGGSGKEGDDDDVTFTVTLSEAASSSVTVDHATSDGSATAGSDYTSTSGTLTFDAGATNKTFTVPIADDDCNEDVDETFTVTLSNASGADLGTATATGTIENRYISPLTARFEDMPAEHAGSAFTFALALLEEREDGRREAARPRVHARRGRHHPGQSGRIPPMGDHQRKWGCALPKSANLYRYNLFLPPAACLVAVVARRRLVPAPPRLVPVRAP